MRLSIPNNKRLKSLHPFTDLSDRVCSVAGCTTQIKTRLVLIRDASICYRHWHRAELVRRNEIR